MEGRASTEARMDLGTWATRTRTKKKPDRGESDRAKARPLLEGYDMTAQTKVEHSATYAYPGALFAEETTRKIDQPTLAAAVAAQPDEDGYFGRDGWYAVRVTSATYKRFTSDDGDEEWVRQGSSKVVGNWVVGERFHYSDIEPTDRNAILISNIKVNSRDGGYGVLTRAGNWQIASDYTAVVSPVQVSA